MWCCIGVMPLQSELLPTWLRTTARSPCTRAGPLPSAREKIEGTLATEDFLLNRKWIRKIIHHYKMEANAILNGHKCTSMLFALIGWWLWAECVKQLHRKALDFTGIQGLCDVLISDDFTYASYQVFRYLFGDYKVSGWNHVSLWWSDYIKYSPLIFLCQPCPLFLHVAEGHEKKKDWEHHVPCHTWPRFATKCTLSREVQPAEAL